MTEPAPPTDTYRPFPSFADWAAVPLDSDTLDRHTAILDELRGSTDPAALDRAVQTATRAAAIDTGAIEGLYDVDRGFTMTVAVRSLAWEAVVAAREPVVRSSFEDALRAYDYVLDLATSRTDVSEKAIREIHQQICASQAVYKVVTSAGVQERPMPKGEYKETPNNPTSRSTGRVHPYAPPIDVPAEMHRLVEELRSAAFTYASPILQAAYAHYAFVAIHPFADGNGRVARALASVYLYRRPGVPLVIFADQKDAYLDALEEADAGRPGRFVRFVQERVIDVIGLVQLSAGAPDRPVNSSIASLREAMLSKEGLPHAELDAIAGRLLTAARNELLAQVDRLELPEGVSLERGVQQHGVGVESGYRMVPGLGASQGVTLRAASPVGVSAQAEIGVRVRRSDVEGPMFQLVDFLRAQTLSIELREAYPTLSAVLELKIRLWIEGMVEAAVARLDIATRRALQERGYL